MDQNVSKERLAIHEASHAVVAKLFEENLYLQKMTIAEESDTMADTEGTKKLGMIGVVGKESLWVAPGVVSLAGMVGEIIAAQSRTQILQAKETILGNPNKYIDKLLGRGDFILFEMDAEVNAWHYGTKGDYEVLCLRFLIDFLCRDSVWPVVEQLKEAVLQKESLTLHEQELDNVFQLTGYTTYIKEHRNKLLEPFRNTVDTSSPDWQKEQMMSGGDVDLFSKGEDDINT